MHPKKICESRLFSTNKFFFSSNSKVERQLNFQFENDLLSLLIFITNHAWGRKK